MTYFLAALLLAQATCKPQPFSIEDAKAVVMQTPRILKYQKKNNGKPLFVGVVRPKGDTAHLDQIWIFQVSNQPFGEEEIAFTKDTVDLMTVDKQTLEVYPVALDYPPPIRTKEVLKVQRQLRAEHCVSK
ncbi:MAG TPA: hypothetical protein VNR20_07990 [Terriglobales bacterium]|nr:hypothetical protein [Terriglobales bacterium]